MRQQEEDNEKQNVDYELANAGFGIDEEVGSAIQAKTLQEWIYYTLTKGKGFSNLSFAYQILNTGVVLLATTVFLISTLPEYWDKTNRALDGLEAFSVAFFTFDYVLRLLTCKNKVRWFFKVTHLIDIISILPYYVELILISSSNKRSVSSLVVLRIFRLIRTLWTFKIARYSKLVPLFAGALVRSRDGFVLFILNILILMVCISGVLFYCEQTISTFDPITRHWVYNDGTISPFQSIPVTFWFFMVTITTVGYGDIYPRSDLGKTVAVLTMLIGILIIAVPVAVFSVNFTAAWDERQDKLRTDSYRKLKSTYAQKSTALKKLLPIIRKRMSAYSIKVVALREQFEKLTKEEVELRELIELSASLGVEEKPKENEEEEEEDDKDIEMAVRVTTEN